jgi:hypothetical protein
MRCKNRFSLHRWYMCTLTSDVDVSRTVFRNFSCQREGKLAGIVEDLPEHPDEWKNF